MRPPVTSILFARDHNGPHSTRQQLARSARDGRTRRIAVGAYLPSHAWQELNELERYRARVRAVAETRRFRPVLSHWSAAALHGLPILGGWPEHVHITVGQPSGGRSRNGVVKHSLRLDEEDVVEIDGLLVTSVSRTVIDLASSAKFRDAVVAADHALRVDRFGRKPPMTVQAELWGAWERRMPFSGHARARAVIEFAETQAGSPLETVSRVTMKEIGCPRPLLQTSYFDGEGFIGDVDFDWPEFRVVGEADGESKYLDESLRSGRTTEQVVLDEKVREDRLRALPRGVARWPWRVAMDPSALRARLARAGLPTGIREPW